jgi:hypothetical protein
MSFGWYVDQPPAATAGASSAARVTSGRRIHITGSNAGVQAALYVYAEPRLVVAVLSNSWGIGSRSGELVGSQPTDLPARIAEICLR